MALCYHPVSLYDCVTIRHIYYTGIFLCDTLGTQVVRANGERPVLGIKERKRAGNVNNLHLPTTMSDRRRFRIKRTRDSSENKSVKRVLFPIAEVEGDNVAAGNNPEIPSPIELGIKCYVDVYGDYAKCPHAAEGPNGWLALLSDGMFCIVMYTHTIF